MIKFYCSHCGAKISAESEHAGETANCPTCGEELVVPASSLEGVPEIQQPVTPPVAQSLPPVPRAQKKPAPKSGKKKMVKIAATAVALILVVCCFFVIQKKSYPDLENPKVITQIREEAVSFNVLQTREKGGENLAYLPNQESPYTGWMEKNAAGGGYELTHIKSGVLDGPFMTFHQNGQKCVEGFNKDGKKDGREISWYENGNKFSEIIYENGLVITLVDHFKPNGEECTESKIENGNGSRAFYLPDGTEVFVMEYKDGIGGIPHD